MTKIKYGSKTAQCDPRKTLGFETPAERFNACVALTGSSRSRGRRLSKLISVQFWHWPVVSPIKSSVPSIHSIHFFGDNPP